MQSTRVACIALASWVTSMTAHAVEDRVPAPNSEDREAALDRVRELFEAKYRKRKPAEKLSLARELLQTAEETGRDEPSIRFVLHTETRDLAAAAGDVDTTLAAVEELVKAFAVDPMAARTEALALVSKSVRDENSHRKVAASALRESRR